MTNSGPESTTNFEVLDMLMVKGLRQQTFKSGRYFDIDVRQLNKAFNEMKESFSPENIEKFKTALASCQTANILHFPYAAIIAVINKMQPQANVEPRENFNPPRL